MAKKSAGRSTHKKTPLKLTDDQIKRLDSVVQIKKDPLKPFKGLIAFLQSELGKVKGEPTVTFKVAKLAAMMPKHGDYTALSLLLPSALKERLGETGWNDGGDADHNRYDGDGDDGPNMPDPAGD